MKKTILLGMVLVGLSCGVTAANTVDESNVAESNEELIKMYRATDGNDFGNYEEGNPIELMYSKRKIGLVTEYMIKKKKR